MDMTLIRYYCCMKQDNYVQYQRVKEMMRRAYMLRTYHAMKYNEEIDWAVCVGALKDLFGNVTNIPKTDQELMELFGLSKKN